MEEDPTLLEIYKLPSVLCHRETDASDKPALVLSETESLHHQSSFRIF